MKTTLPVSKNEMERLVSLSELDLDYAGLKNRFQDLAKLAAMISGAPVALINFIDADTQWTVANYGFEIEQMPREDSVCQYTVIQNDNFEVANLQADSRFSDKFYVNGEVATFKYYFGLPLATKKGQTLGSLCLLAHEKPDTINEKVVMLEIMAAEIVNRLKMVNHIHTLATEAHDANIAKFKAAHDIRGPLNGIIGLAQIIIDQGSQNSLEEVLQFVTLIKNSSRSVVELAEEILSTEHTTADNELATHRFFDLENFKAKLEELYTPQSINKGIRLVVNTKGNHVHVPFSKSKLLQITGNIISNALKFTPSNGTVTVTLDLLIKASTKMVHIVVCDSGVGLDEKSIARLLNGSAPSSDGTSGETGYGFGMTLVSHLIDTLKGTINITSKPGEGACFDVLLPVSKF